MSAKQILIAAAGAGGGPPPPSGPAFDPPSTGFGMFGPYTFPSFIPFSPIEYIDFTSAGGITIYNTPPVPSSGPTSWDTTGGTYAATTGVTFNVSTYARNPVSGLPFVQLLLLNHGPPFPGSYIIDGGGGGGGINAGATFGLDMQTLSASPGDAINIILNGTMDLVDAATRTTVFSSVSFSINILVDFI